MLAVSPAAVPTFSSEPPELLSPQIRSTRKAGETPCGRHGFPEVWEEFQNSLVSYPKTQGCGWDGGDPHRARATADRAGGKTNRRHRSSQILLSSAQLLWKMGGNPGFGSPERGTECIPTWQPLLSLAGNDFLALWITISTQHAPNLSYLTLKIPTLVFKKINRPSPPNSTLAPFPSQEENHNGKVLRTINSKRTRVCMERQPNTSG